MLLLPTCVDPDPGTIRVPFVMLLAQVCMNSKKIVLIFFEFAMTNII